VDPGAHPASATAPVGSAGTVQLAPVMTAVHVFVVPLQLTFNVPLISVYPSFNVKEQFTPLARVDGQLLITP
jgi:hypothetical protein